MAGDEGGGVGEEPESGLGDLLGGAHAADGLLVDHGLLFLGVGGEVGLEDGSLDEAGTDGVYSDAAVGVFEGSILGEADDAVLAGDEGCRAGEPDEAGNRSIVDDGASATLEHFRDLVLHAEPDAGEVDAYDPVPEVQGVTGDIGAAVFQDAGVVESAVQALRKCRRCGRPWPVRRTLETHPS